MALVTLHTRLFTLLSEARTIRQYAKDSATQMAASVVSANAVVGLAQRIQTSLSNVVTPEMGKQDIEDYAALQFNDPDFGLQAKLTGISYLANQAIAAARQTVPMDSFGYILKDVWNADGSVSVRQLTPADTASLVNALNQLWQAIPE